MMKKTILILFISLGVIASLAACQQDDGQNIQSNIQFVPNEDYVGDPNPEVEIEMKLTDEEMEEFKELQKEILSGKEGDQT